MKLEPEYLLVLFLKTPQELCRHALALEGSDRDEFWFVCGVIGSKRKDLASKLRAASLKQDASAARRVLMKLEAVR